jgi:UDP-N-acetylglucosamine 2-epimerase (non-hydrolysing)/GDP/UDP-N,N'-diacetylbacillosamine 2-epimerase (hydrolysing)
MEIFGRLEMTYRQAKRRKICVVTGSRAEYGYLFPIMKLIKKDPYLRLQLIVTGMHLSPRHGNTFGVIEKDGFKIDYKVDMLIGGNSSVDMANSLGVGICGIAGVLKNLQPDIVLVFGDRIEALAGAIAGTYMNIAVAHIHGGDKSKGDIDERARHAITKLSHIHFPASRLSARRIAMLGERKEFIFTAGSTLVDTIMGFKLRPPWELKKKFSLKNRGYFLIIQHPVTTEPELSYSQMKETISAVKNFDVPKIIILPNADAGFAGINKAIDEVKGDTKFKIFKNLERVDYLSLLKHACVLVGNSSSGIIEASSFKLPVINIGIRQEGRERGMNVIDAPHKKDAIIRAINKALYDRRFREGLKKCKNPYDNGRASERIVKVLAEIKLDKRLLQKQITY